MLHGRVQISEPGGESGQQANYRQWRGPSRFESGRHLPYLRRRVSSVGAFRRGNENGALMCGPRA